MWFVELFKKIISYLRISDFPKSNSSSTIYLEYINSIDKEDIFDDNIF